MKKLFALLLALLMVFSMVACAAKQEPAKTEEPAAEEKNELPSGRPWPPAAASPTS